VTIYRYIGTFIASELNGMLKRDISISVWLITTVTTEGKSSLASIECAMKHEYVAKQIHQQIALRYKL
jgi:hypothetical protein